MQLIPFRPSLLLRNAHLQTMLPDILTHRKKDNLQFEMLPTPEDHVIMLACRAGSEQTQKRIIKLIIPGIEGSHMSAVIKLLLRAPELKKDTSYIMSHRGIACPSPYISFYHAGLTDDLALTVAHLQVKHPGSVIHAIGYSMGANVLLKYLGEGGASIALATAISTPYSLTACANKMPLFYHKMLLHSIRQRMSKGKLPDSQSWKIKLDWRKIKTLVDFDRVVTAPYFGFADVEDYYQQASCNKILQNITSQCQLISAHDDPFVPPSCWPDPLTLPRCLELMTPQFGGHMGFVHNHCGLNTWIAKVIHYNEQKYFQNIAKK